MTVYNCPKPSKNGKKSKQKKVAESGVLDLWRQVVIAQAHNQCEYPNCNVKWTQLHPHHYYGRANKSTKYDPLNGITLCHLHHANGVEAAHIDPDWKEKWLASGKRPDGWLEELTRRKNIKEKDNDEFRGWWKEYLKEVLKTI